MRHGESIIFLFLFVATIFIMYISVRRSWLTLGLGLIFGTIMNALLIMLYYVSEGAGVIPGFVRGLGIGLIFTGLTVTAAAYFRANSRDARPPTPR